MTFRAHTGPRDATHHGSPNNRHRTAPNKVTIRQGYTPTYAEKAEHTATIFRKDGKLRRTVGDMCDTCLRPMRVNRGALKLRIRGWRFMCFQCWRAKGKPSCKENKLWLG